MVHRVVVCWLVLVCAAVTILTIRPSAQEPINPGVGDTLTLLRSLDTEDRIRPLGIIQQFSFVRNDPQIHQTLISELRRTNTSDHSLALAQAVSAQTPVDDVLANLKSDSIPLRSHAFALIASGAVSIDAITLKPVLIDLLERENAVIDSALQSGTSVSQQYGEGYSEYYSALFNRVASLTAAQDARAILALVSGAYTEGSVFERETLPQFGEALVPAVVSTMSHRVAEHRLDALDVATELGKRQKDNPGLLTPQSIASLAVSIRRNLAASTTDGERLRAVRALGWFGDASDVPALQALATTDPMTQMFRGTLHFPVREEALKAISQITAR